MKDNPLKNIANALHKIAESLEKIGENASLTPREPQLDTPRPKTEPTPVPQETEDPFANMGGEPSQPAQPEEPVAPKRSAGRPRKNPEDRGPANPPPAQIPVVTLADIRTKITALEKDAAVKKDDLKNVILKYTTAQGVTRCQDLVDKDPGHDFAELMSLLLKVRRVPTETNANDLL